MTIEEAKKIVTWREVDGLSFRELRDKIGVRSHSTAMKRYNEALKVIRSFAGEITKESPTPQNADGQAKPDAETVSPLSPNGDQTETGLVDHTPYDLPIDKADDPFLDLQEPPLHTESTPSKVASPPLQSGANSTSSGTTTAPVSAGLPWGEDADLFEKLMAPLPPDEEWRAKNVCIMGPDIERAVKSAPDFEKWKRTAAALAESFVGDIHVAHPTLGNIVGRLALDDEQKEDLAVATAKPAYRVFRAITAEQENAGPISELVEAGIAIYDINKGIKRTMAADPEKAMMYLTDVRAAAPTEAEEGGGDGQA